VILWDARTYKFLNDPSGEAGEAVTVVFSPDSKLLAAAFFGPTHVEQGRIVIWDAQQGCGQGTGMELGGERIRRIFLARLAIS